MKAFCGSGPAPHRGINHLRPRFSTLLTETQETAVLRRRIRTGLSIIVRHRKSIRMSANPRDRLLLTILMTFPANSAGQYRRIDIEESFLGAKRAAYSAAGKYPHSYRPARGRPRGPPGIRLPWQEVSSNPKLPHPKAERGKREQLARPVPVSAEMFPQHAFDCGPLQPSPMGRCTV